MNRLYAGTILRRNNRDKETCSVSLVFQWADTEREAKEIIERECGEFVGYTTVEVEVHLVPSNPPPPIPDWLAALKKGDIVYSEYGGGELAPCELLDKLNEMRKNNKLSLSSALDVRKKIRPKLARKT